MDLVLPTDILPLGEICSPMDNDPARWKEVQVVVRCARAALAPGPKGVPYCVYKGACHVLKYLWKLMVIAWNKEQIRGCGIGQAV